MKWKSRTIFFNGPKGHRWVTHLVPTKAEIPIPSAPPLDDKAQHRRCFFSSLNAMRSRLARYGVSPDDVRKMLCKAVRCRTDVAMHPATVGGCRSRSTGDARIAGDFLRPYFSVQEGMMASIPWITLIDEPQPTGHFSVQIPGWLY